MTTLEMIKLFFEIGMILLGGYALYREKDLIRFERKVAKYVKAFFKACYYTILEKKQRKNKNKTVRVSTYRNPEYDQMLANLNKASKTEDIMVA